jgi:hypothetical protein
MGPQRLLRPLTIVSTLALAAVIAGPGIDPPGAAPVRAAGEVNGFFVDNIHSLAGYENGSGWVAYGASLYGVSGATYTARPCNLTPTAPNCQGWIEVRVSGRPPADLADGIWEAHFAAPLGEQLAVGTYEATVRPIDRTGTHPGLEIRPFTTGYCLDPTGRFTVHELEMSGDDVTAFSASFVQTCAGAQEVWGPLYGEVRLASSRGFRAATSNPPALDFGSHPTGTALPARTVTLKSRGSLAVTFGAADIVGDGARSFTLESNGCSGVTLQPGETCSLGVSARPHTNSAMTASLRIADDTIRRRREIPLQVVGVGEVAGTISIAPSAFYPVADDYLDEVAVEGSRDEAAALQVAIRSAASGEVVRRGALRSASGAYRWAWDGTVAGGGLAPAGDYDLSATLVTPVGDRKVVERRVRLSHDWVSWTKRTTLLDGDRFCLYGTAGGGAVSRTRSAYPNGVLLDSGRGSAVVEYAFRTEHSRIYSALSLQVRGRSPNGHEAVIAIWNPKLGGYRDLASFDAARAIGPDFTWWKTSAPMAGRRQNGFVRGIVVVWKGLGGRGSATFDVKAVRVVYSVGVLHPADGTMSSGRALAATPQRDRGIVGRTVHRLAGRWPLPSVAQRADSMPIEDLAPGAEATREP